MSVSGDETIGFALTWISLIHVLIACVISILMVIVIVYHGHHNRLRHDEKLTLTLSVNIYLAVFIYVVTLGATNIETLLGDLYGHNSYSSWCIFKGYWIIVSAYTMYQAFVLEVSTAVCLTLDSEETELKLGLKKKKKMKKLKKTLPIVVCFCF